MILEHSIIRSSGQIWKVHVWALGTLASLAAVLVAFLVFAFPRNNVWFVSANVFGTILVICSFVFALISIKCPSCEKKWILDAIFRNREMNWYDWLDAQATCPNCGYPGDCKEDGKGSDC